jgi:Cof subfamily protein (haloacid dehalogenase superfamily)
MIRLLALDLDDTLLDEQLRISPGNREAILEAERRGVQVVLASGRATESLLAYGRELGMDRRPGYFIAYNGSAIVESDTGQAEWGVKVDPATIAEAWDLAMEMDQAIQTYVPGAILVSHDNEYTRKDTELTGIPNRVVDRSEFVAEARVKLLFPGEPRSLDPVETRFKLTFAGRANMFRSKPYFFEFMRPEADKGLALERLAGLHGIPRESVMACGDSWNDEGMIRWAGVSVAMANAHPDIKKLATWVTTRDHHHDGVAEAIERFILTGC